MTGLATAAWQMFVYFALFYAGTTALIYGARAAQDVYRHWRRGK